MYYVKPFKKKKKMSATNYYTINMSFRRGDGDMDVFTSRRFKTKSHAVRAMHKMRKYGFRRSLSETWTAKYNLVTYTRYGDVVECEDYSSVRHSDMEIVGTSLPVEHNINMKISSPETPSAHTHSSSKDIFSKYTLEEYGKGYLMRPPRGDANWGMKYFYVDGGCGWWNAGQNAWFFQSKHFDFLRSNGAVLSSSIKIPKSTQTRKSKRLKFQKLNELADRLLKSKSSKSSPIYDEEHYVSEEDSDYVPPEEESEEEKVEEESEEEEKQPLQAKSPGTPKTRGARIRFTAEEVEYLEKGYDKYADEGGNYWAKILKKYVHPRLSFYS